MGTDEIAPGTLVRLVGDIGVYLGANMSEYGVKLGDLGVVVGMRARGHTYNVRIFNDIDPSAPWVLEHGWIEVVES